VPGLSQAERQRRRFRPDDVRVLLVGESPPAGGTFFYDANSKLYRSTKAAFELAIPGLRREPDFLAAFQRLGCYVDDLALHPVNQLPKDEREAACLDGIPPLARRIKECGPGEIAIVIIRIERPVRDAMRLAGMDPMLLKKLPFPGRPEHTERYQSELAGLVRTWRRRRILSV
jgi:hypothetical protein